MEYWQSCRRYDLSKVGIPRSLHRANPTVSCAWKRRQSDDLLNFHLAPLLVHFELGTSIFAVCSGLQNPHTHRHTRKQYTATPTTTATTTAATTTTARTVATAATTATAKAPTNRLSRDYAAEVEIGTLCVAPPVPKAVHVIDFHPPSLHPVSFFLALAAQPALPSTASRLARSLSALTLCLYHCSLAFRPGPNDNASEPLKQG